MSEDNNPASTSVVYSRSLGAQKCRLAELEPGHFFRIAALDADDQIFTRTSWGAEESYPCVGLDGRIHGFYGSRDVYPLKVEVSWEYCRS